MVVCLMFLSKKLVRFAQLILLVKLEILYHTFAQIYATDTFLESSPKI